MQNKIYLVFLSLAMSIAATSLSAQEYSDQDETGVYGYTSIDYDDTTFVVTAYSETDIYGPSAYYYEANVYLSSGSHGSGSMGGASDYASASLSFQGAAGNTYYAQGYHSAAILNQFVSLAWDDEYGLINWAQYDINDPFSYPFTPFSPDTDPSPSINLGETYDQAQTSVPQSCGSGDPRTTMIQEYVTFNTPYYSQCSEFTQTVTDPYFTFAQLNYGTYSWAILRSYFLSNLDSLRGLTSFTINSAYRNPAKEASVSTKYYPGSRHQYGDAVDVASNGSNWPVYQADGHKLGACVEPTSVQGGSTAHVHMDWRAQATVGPTVGSSCSPGW